MTEARKEELLQQALQIIDSVDAPEDLLTRCEGGPGCILERLFPDAPEWSDDKPSYYRLAGLAGLEPYKICEVNDEFVQGRCNKATLKNAIAALRSCASDW